MVAVEAAGLPQDALVARAPVAPVDEAAQAAGRVVAPPAASGGLVEEIAGKAVREAAALDDALRANGVVQGVGVEPGKGDSRRLGQTSCRSASLLNKPGLLMSSS